MEPFHQEPPLNRACPPFEDMPELMKFLFSIQKTWAHLFIFEILTASRQEAARGLRWKDLDFEKKLWVISIETDKLHSQDPNKRTIVLSDKAIEYLKSLPRGKDEDLVFPLDYLITGETVPFKQSNLWKSFSRCGRERLPDQLLKRGQEVSWMTTTSASIRKVWNIACYISGTPIGELMTAPT